MKKRPKITKKCTQKLETMKIDDILYFPCRICNRLYKEKQLAIQHFQKCRPRIYLSVANNEPERNVKNDPYEMIPEEMDNNNSIDSGWSSRFQKKPIDSKNIPKRGKKINKKGAKEVQIQERLKKISETLKKRREIETTYEEEDDCDDEEERRAIEDRLSSLNKDMENFCENDEDIKEEDNMVIITQSPDGQLHGCRKCPEVFVSALELFRHSRNKHTYPRIIMAPSEIQKLMKNKDRSSCPVCEKPLNSTYRSIYVKHLLTHSIVAEHECPICKRKFRRRDHMRAHQKRHIV